MCVAASLVVILLLLTLGSAHTQLPGAEGPNKGFVRRSDAVKNGLPYQRWAIIWPEGLDERAGRTGRKCFEVRVSWAD